MATPHRWFNYILFSLVGGFIIWLASGLIGSLIFDFPFKDWLGRNLLVKGFLLAFLIPTLVIFGILNFAIRSFFKLNVAHLYDLLPDLNSERTAKNIEALSEQISSLTDDKSKEISTLNERENYRREFLGNVSHELKTPLFSIQGYLLTLIEGGVEDESIRDKYLNRINKSVERLTYIVKDLDMITELESGNLKLAQKPFNILALTKEIFDLLEIKAQNNNVLLKIENPLDIPIGLWATLNASNKF